MHKWPRYNYPIFIALTLLAATAATLAIGDKKRAEELAIYAYYFLVIGVAFRFFELALPENILQKFRSSILCIADYIMRNVSKMIDLAILIMDKMIQWLYIRMPDLYWAIIETKMRISQHMKHALKTIDVDQKIAVIFNRPYTKKQRLQRTKLEEKIDLISNVSRNTAILLFIFFIISLIYGWMIDWWFVEKYLSNLVLFILGFLTLHIFIRVRF
jgi:hypothetical protein